MSAKPLLFSGQMVRALLEGRKSQTRRICKYRIYSNGFGTMPGSYEIACHNDYLPPSAMLMDVGKYTTSNVEGWESSCPYGKPGDLLWVRETILEWRNADGSFSHVAAFAADGYALQGAERWTSSIHMPRSASRLTLRITDVRVQRLWEISESDAKAEGVTPAVEHNALKWQHYSPHGVAYAALWESINGAGSWDANPWVWAISFEVIKQNVDAVLAQRAAA